MKKILIIGALASAAGSANAATLVYNYGPSPGFNVQMFNPALGTLQSVKTEITQTVSYRFTEARLNLDPGTTGAIDWTGETRGFQYFSGCSQGGGGEACPSIIVTGMGIYNTGAGPYDFNFSGSQTNVWATADNLIYFTGTGTRPSQPSFSDPVTVRSYQFGNQVGFARISGFGVGSSSLRITYTYSTGTVPEPATWLMTIVGFGAAGCAMRARRRNVVKLTNVT